MIDFANALGVTPIVTLYCGDEPGDYADLVEYCWGNESTPMGLARIADGHELPYKISHFELGNEQNNPHFVDQVTAMEAKASQLQLGKQFNYLLSNGWGDRWPNATMAKQASALGLGDHLLWDIHVNSPNVSADPDHHGLLATDVAEHFFANSSYDTWGAMNLETNFAIHTVGRMLEEARQLNLLSH